jgi:hypothetical protein
MLVGEDVWESGTPAPPSTCAGIGLSSVMILISKEARTKAGLLRAILRR